MKMKNKIICLVFLVLIFASISLSVNATTVEPANLLNKSFEGRVDHNWGYVTTESCVRTNTGDAYVNWKKSSQSTRHNMWFRTVNSNGEARGEGLLEYLSKGGYPTSAEKNHYYWLQSRRENSVDPVTTVSGSWNA